MNPASPKSRVLVIVPLPMNEENRRHRISRALCQNHSVQTGL